MSFDVKRSAFIHRENKNCIVGCNNVGALICRVQHQSMLTFSLINTLQHVIKDLYSWEWKNNIWIINSEYIDLNHIQIRTVTSSITTGHLNVWFFMPC